MEIQEYFQKKKDFQHGLLEFLDGENKTMDDFISFFKYVNELSIYKNKNELLPVLKLLVQISNDHHRYPNFFKKLDEIFFHLNDTIKLTFSNTEIFNIFQSNKRLLLFLIEQKVLIIDQTIFDLITDESFMKKDYLIYFWPELQSFASEEMKSQIEENYDQLLQKSSRVFENFRKNGENDSDVCKMIRNDQLEDFIAYNRTSYIVPSKNVYPSPFETNQFLLLKKPTLIEYAAFFGSFKIFEYLKMDNAVLKPSLWIYAMHGRNIELLHLLENSGIEPDDKTFKECFVESIKCHHNDIANYIQYNLMKDKSIDEFFVSSKIVQSLNFHYFPNDFSNIFAFFSFCENNYLPFVDIVLKNSNLDINKKIGLNNPSDLYISFKLSFLYHFKLKFFLNKVFKKIFFIWRLYILLLKKGLLN